MNFYKISWLCFDRLRRKRNNLEIYIKIQDKSVTNPKSKIRLCEFVLTKLLTISILMSLKPFFINYPTERDVPLLM